VNSDTAAQAQAWESSHRGNVFATAEAAHAIARIVGPALCKDGVHYVPHHRQGAGGLDSCIRSGWTVTNLTWCKSAGWDRDLAIIAMTAAPEALAAEERETPDAEAH